VYTRKNNAPQAPPSDPRFPPTMPPPPPKDSFPLSSTLPKNDEIDLNVDIVLENINVHVSLIEMINIPLIRNKVEKLFRVQGEPRDPYVLIQANNCIPHYDEHPCFYITLRLNNKWLKKYMLNYGASVNIMTFKVIIQFGLEVTRPYGNVCGLNPRLLVHMF
jgi:hypothetical protein